MQRDQNGPTVYISLSPPLIFLLLPALASPSLRRHHCLPSLSISRASRRLLSLAPRVFRVRLRRAVNGEQKALGAHAPALSLSLSLSSHISSFFSSFSFFLPCHPLRHADHRARGPLSPTPRNLPAAVVCLSLLRLSDPSRIALPFRRWRGGRREMIKGTYAIKR